MIQSELIGLYQDVTFSGLLYNLINIVIVTFLWNIHADLEIA